ncbi:MAG: ribonuclease HII [Hyphomicrobiaceae bacterium]|nr:ribonuclease HII [Hyphomicrobiaceae bacterium]
MPDFSVEASLGGQVAGIDEAGRGPWAGPVVAAAVILPLNLDVPWLPLGLDDSKKLRKPVRELLYDHILASTAHSVGLASVEEIDEMNILQAAMLAMRRAFANLPQEPQYAIVDGNRDPGLGVPTRCLVGGDASSLSIAAASILAKVTRDRIMEGLAREFPGYEWEKNAGHGTKQHQQGLAENGVTPHHRRTFAPIAKILK